MQFKFKLILSMIITAITLSYCFHEIKEGYILIPVGGKTIKKTGIKSIESLILSILFYQFIF